MDSELKLLPLNLLDPHPERSPVFDLKATARACAAVMRSGFPKCRAVVVRPHETGRYQVVVGYGLVQGASYARLSTVWAWIQSMSDDEALATVLLDNLCAGPDHWKAHRARWSRWLHQLSERE